MTVQSTEVTFFNTNLHHAIATDVDLTTIGTGIVIVAFTIVAVFSRIKNPIATEMSGATFRPAPPVALIRDGNVPAWQRTNLRALCWIQITTIWMTLRVSSAARHKTRMIRT